ncbi:MAG TPA: PAS domain-containing protein, partial [Allocoleopsis sp.]
MEDIQRTKTELIAELQSLRDQLALSEATLQAIQQGKVDALVVTTHKGTQIFTLQSADQSYRLLVEEMQQGAAILSSEGLIVYANSSLSKILQRSLEQLIGSYFQQFLSPQDALLFQDLIQSTQREKRHALEMFLIRADAIEIPVYLSIHHLDFDEVPMKCLVITNLTEQKRHEQTLAAERLARLILEQAGEAIIVCDATGQVIRVSQATSQLWEGNLLFQSFDSFCSLYFTKSNLVSSLTPSPQIPSAPLPPERVPFSIQSVLDGTSYQGLEVELERPDGQILSLVLNARPLTDQANHFRGAVVILTDITQRKQAELALKASKIQLQQQLAEIETIYQ